MKHILSLVLAILCIVCIPVNIAASNITDISDTTSDVLFHADTLYGKIFHDGVNVEVDNKQMFDTSIHGVILTSDYRLQFQFNDNSYSIPTTPLSAVENNVNSDHFIFSTVGFADPYFNIVNISMTYNANVHDLMPANYDLIGKKVLSLIFEEKSSNDVYYWQGEVSCNNTITNANIINTVHILSSSDETILRENANEFYYRNTPTQSFTLTEDEYNEMIATATADSETALNTRSASSHNPLYNTYDVPDSVFMSETDKWSRGVLISNERNYFAYSSTKYGSSNIYTRIMILSFTGRNTREGYVEGDEVYSAKNMLQVEVELNETVVYYPSQDTFDYLLGGNDTVSLYPSIEIKKKGNDSSHVVVSREFNGLGTKGTSTASKIASIMVGVIDDYLVSGAIGYIDDILDISGIGTESYTFGSYKIYKQTAALQEEFYDVAMGSMEIAMDGFIRSPGDFYNLICEFNADTQRIALNTTWVLHYSLS